MNTHTTRPRSRTGFTVRLTAGYKRVDKKKKQFHGDLMQLLAQYQEQGFALGLKCGLMLAGELFYRETL